MTSYGHSKFLIKGEGKSILLNPYKSIGCTKNLDQSNDLKFDFILASSRLADEGYNPNNALMFVDPGVYKVKNTIFNGISVPHDRVGGRRYGMATIWIWNQNDAKIVHMGGAAGKITFENQIFLDRPDILFISIGGGEKSYNGKEAAALVKKLKPKIVIPVHFLRSNRKIEGCSISNEDLFIENITGYKIKRVNSKLNINPNKIDKKTIFLLR